MQEYITPDMKVFKIDLRKVLYPHYPFLTDEFADEYLIIER